MEQAVQLFALGSLWSPHGQCMLHLGPHGQLGTVKGSFRDDIACMDDQKKREKFFVRQESSLDGQLGTFYCFMVVAWTIEKMFLVLIWVRALLGRTSSVGAPQGYAIWEWTRGASPSLE